MLQSLWSLAKLLESLILCISAYGAINHLTWSGSRAWFMSCRLKAEGTTRFLSEVWSKAKECSGLAELSDLFRVHASGCIYVTEWLLELGNVSRIILALHGLVTSMQQYPCCRTCASRITLYDQIQRIDNSTCMYVLLYCLGLHANLHLVCNVSIRLFVRLRWVQNQGILYLSRPPVPQASRHMPVLTKMTMENFTWKIRPILNEIIERIMFLMLRKCISTLDLRFH